MMGDRFCRMWDFYLASAELGFLNGSNFVFQILISARRDDVPVIRDYVVDEERRLLVGQPSRGAASLHSMSGTSPG